MTEKKFYDIHCHAMNLSHPNLLAFIASVKLPVTTMLGVYYLLWPILPLFLAKKLSEGNQVRKAKNLLSVMENDIGSIFFLMEDCLTDAGRFSIIDRQITIGGNTYDKIVLTPLLMDFGYKNMHYSDIHYNKPPQKPVIEQVIDVFNGIKKYKKERPHGIFEIYPFLGLNTFNYELRHIEKMLTKYFSSYAGTPQALHRNMGDFSGDIDSIGSNYFAGIKVYPLLGFDPWPREDREQLKKVEFLYEYCARYQIPITTHCSDEGFVVIEKKKRKPYSSPERWREVLKRYPTLKVNFAHFGSREEWTIAIIALMSEYENVYADFSYIAYEDKYYKNLHRLLDWLDDSALNDRVKERLLFGSDFMMLLNRLNSYCEYLGYFSTTQYFTSAEKDLFCSKNPERFLFGEGKAAPELENVETFNVLVSAGQRV